MLIALGSRVCRNFLGWSSPASLVTRQAFRKGSITFSLGRCHVNALIRTGPNTVLRSFQRTRGGSQLPYKHHRTKWPILNLLVRAKATAAESLLRQKVTKSPVFPTKSEFSRLLSLAKPERLKIAVALCLLLVSSTVTLLVPFSMGKVIDTIFGADHQPEEMKRKLTQLTLILCGVFLGGAAANAGRVYLMNMAGQKVINRLRKSVFSSILKQEVAFFDKNRTGELVNRLSADSEITGQAVTQNISDGLRSTAQVLGGVGMMFYTSPQLAMAILVIVPPVAVTAIIYGRYTRKITQQLQDSLASATQVAEERISNIRTVRAFAQEEKEQGVYNQRIEDILDLARKQAIARAGFFSTMGLSGNYIILSVLYLGGMMMNAAQITVGDLSAFLAYAGYVGISIGGLSSFYSEMNKALGASTRLWHIIDRVPQIPLDEGATPAEESLRGTIRFENIHFSYPARPDAAIFQGLDMEVPAGSVMAVVGASGSGKSTLASLLLRYYDPQEGAVYLDGHDIKSLSANWLRNNIGTVSQEPILFSSTIADNIAYGASDPSAIDMKTITEVSKMANAYNFIRNFPKQFDTLVGERGIMLSGGQRQRIAIARAIIKDPKILLLDEATSALDAESEHLVQEALERVMVGRSVMTIAHRLSTIRKADTIAVLDAGRIVEIGSYQVLMALEQGHFRKLVERQTVTQ